MQKMIKKILEDEKQKINNELFTMIKIIMNITVGFVLVYNIMIYFVIFYYLQPTINTH